MTYLICVVFDRNIVFLNILSSMNGFPARITDVSFEERIPNQLKENIRMSVPPALETIGFRTTGNRVNSCSLSICTRLIRI